MATRAERLIEREQKLRQKLAKIQAQQAKLSETKGKRDTRQGQANLSYHRREIEAGSFSRAVALPVKVDPEQVSARLVNGILTVTLKKASAANPRQIIVTAAQEG